MINLNSEIGDLIYSIIGVIKMSKLKLKEIRKVLIVISAGILFSACGNTLINGNGLTISKKANNQIETKASETIIDATSSGDSADTELPAGSLTYPIVGTGQTKCYDNFNEISCPDDDDSFFGQDGNYDTGSFKYQDNEDGTVSDYLTGLMWKQDPGEKVSYAEALGNLEGFELAGYTDWRFPTIKELYSLIDMSGIDPSGCDSIQQCPDIQSFIDQDFFVFEYGQASNGDRMIDSQFASSTLYVGEDTNDQLMFGVNFADGRIKGYGIGPMPGRTEAKTFYVLYVRGNENYGNNDFVDNNDGTITDLATGLTWQQNDSETGMNWETSLNYCANLEINGNDGWRLPDIKELQSILDYSRSPSSTNSAAINSIFSTSSITNERGAQDFPFFWSSTTHVNYRIGGTSASYMAFGEGLGYMRNSWIDIHGAGTQRSDPKIGDVSDYPFGHGPQGDAIRIENYVRCVSN